jgi:hypothetical protein
VRECTEQSVQYKCYASITARSVQRSSRGAPQTLPTRLGALRRSSCATRGDRSRGSRRCSCWCFPVRVAVVGFIAHPESCIDRANGMTSRCSTHSASRGRYHRGTARTLAWGWDHYRRRRCESRVTDLGETSWSAGTRGRRTLRLAVEQRRRRLARLARRRASCTHRFRHRRR